MGVLVDRVKRAVAGPVQGKSGLLCGKMITFDDIASVFLAEPEKERCREAVVDDRGWRANPHIPPHLNIFAGTPQRGCACIRA